MISRMSIFITIAFIFTSCTNSGSSSQSSSQGTPPSGGTATVSGADPYAGPVISDFLRNPEGSVNFTNDPSSAARICLERGLRLPTILELLEEAKSHGAKFDVANATGEYCRNYKIGDHFLGYDDTIYSIAFKDLIYSADKKDRTDPKSGYESPDTCYQRLKYADYVADANVRRMYDSNRREYYTWTRSVSYNPMGGHYQHIAFSNQGSLVSNVDIKFVYASQRSFFFDRGREIRIGVRCVGAESL